MDSGPLDPYTVSEARLLDRVWDWAGQAVEPIDTADIARHAAATLPALGLRVRFPVVGALQRPGTGQSARLGVIFAMLLAGLLLAGAVAIVGSRSPQPSPGPALTPAPLGVFTPTGPMARPRSLHTATALVDGRVLVIGGILNQGLMSAEALDTAEIWDPSTGTFVRTGRLAEARGLHTATLLPDGRVLVVGGDGSGTSASGGSTDTFLASAEIWDPATGSFSRSGSLVLPRSGHSATLLPDGRVLIIGGTRDLGDRQVVTDAEVWDPRTGEFGPAVGIAAPRTLPDGTLLADGRLLVPSSVGAAVEIVDPTAGTTSAPIHLSEPRRDGTLTLLKDGRVLFVGGETTETRRCGTSPRTDGSCFATSVTRNFLDSAEIFTIGAADPRLPGRSPAP